IDLPPTRRPALRVSDRDAIEVLAVVVVSGLELSTFEREAPRTGRSGKAVSGAKVGRSRLPRRGARVEPAGGTDGLEARGRAAAAPASAAQAHGGRRGRRAPARARTPDGARAHRPLRRSQLVPGDLHAGRPRALG